MNDYKLRQLLLAVHAGQIFGYHSASVIGISTATFDRWVRAAENRGVRFKKNRRGGKKNHHVALKDRDQPEAWRIERWGEFRSDKPRSA